MLVLLTLTCLAELRWARGCLFGVPAPVKKVWSQDDAWRGLAAQRNRNKAI